MHDHQTGECSALGAAPVICAGLGNVLDWTGESGQFGKGQLPAGCWHRNHFKNSALLAYLDARRCLDEMSQMRFKGGPISA